MLARLARIRATPLAPNINFDGTNRPMVAEPSQTTTYSVKLSFRLFPIKRGILGNESPGHYVLIRWLLLFAPCFSEHKKMNRKINVRLGAIAAAVTTLAMLTAFVTKAAASNAGPENYPADYPAPHQTAAPAIETAQAAQLQNLQPGYAPQPSTQGAPQGAPDQTLTLTASSSAIVTAASRGIAPVTGSGRHARSAD